MNFVPIKRKGDYSSTEISEYSSASCIRELIQKERYDEAYSNVPVESYAILDFAKTHKPARSLLLNALHEGLDGVFDVSEGFENRVAKVVQRASTYEDAFAEIRTARYSDSRISRITTNAFLKITAADYPSYVKASPIFNLLAAKKEFLKNFHIFDGPMFFTHHEMRCNNDPLSVLTAKGQEKYNLLVGGAYWKSFLL